MRAQTIQKLVLRTVAIAGLVLFSAFFALTYTVPEWVETFAADFIEREASRYVDTTIDELQPPAGDSAVSRLAGKMYERNKEQIESLRSALKEKVHEKKADALARIRDLDCECRDKWAEYFKEGFEFQFGLLQSANDKIVDFIQSSYMQVLTGLKKDIRVFTGCNAAVFLLVLLVSFARPRAMAHLFLPGALLVISTLICSYFYVFEQNWLLTIIYNDYLGFAYLAWLGVVFAVLCDIIWNRARITTEIVNAILNAVGSALSLVPC